ncbi:hypothetical protein DFQ30_005388 [Apophysomyces sp. BC1015]|nr:hypothetical protein DFQ30_005388 [Apophysomyces sp. BC1015]
MLRWTRTSCRLSNRTFTSAAYQSTRLTRPISIAPMVDVSTPAKLLHIIGGSRYVYYTEMHYAQAIIHNSDRLHSFLGPPRSNVVVQLGGSDPVMMANATRIIAENGYHEVNINVGCPSPRVQHGNFGAVLMKTPDVVAEILSAMRVNIPVTVKCRIGVDQLDSYEFFHGFVETLLRKASLPHLLVHARKCILKGLSPKKNRSVPPLNYERVFQIAEAFPDLPITLNGGLDDVEKITMALDNVDGCMIGRKVMNDPLFLQTMDRDYAETLLSQPTHPGSRLPPVSILVKPLMMMYGGRQGRMFRKELFDYQKGSQSFDIRSVVSNALTNAGIAH